jgi:hypothetical protein
MIETDYNRYISTKMNVFLVILSEGTDSERYESLSGTILSIQNEAVTMRMRYAIGLSSAAARAGHITYKLMSEILGVGIQVLADLVAVEHDILHLRLRGNIEVFQCRQAARVDTTIGLNQFLRDVSMESYRIMCDRLTSYIDSSGVPTGITLEETAINLSASGLRRVLPRVAGKALAPLSMFLLDLKEQRPLICTVAELVWTRDDALDCTCGYRFIDIRKKDRDLITRYVRSIAPQHELHDDFKKNWELLDRMFTEESGAKSE